MVDTDALATTIAQHRSTAETDRRLPPGLVEVLRSAGAFGLLTSKRWGGAELALHEACGVLEGFGRLDAAVAWCVWNGNMGFAADMLPEEAAAAIWGGPHDPIVANAAQPCGGAEPVEGGWRLTGRWPMVSAVDIADWVVLFGIAGDQVLAFYVPTADLTVHDTWHTSGLRATGSHAVSVDGVHVPTAFALSPFAPTASGIPAFTQASSGVAAVVLGIAQAALDRTAELLAGRAEVAGRLAAAETALAAAAALFHERVASVDATEHSRARLRAAMSHAAATARDTLVTCLELASSKVVYTDEPLERMVRDGLVACQHGALARATFDVRGRHLLGLDSGTPLV